MNVQFRLRLEVSVYNFTLQTSFKPRCSGRWGGGGQEIKSTDRGECEHGGKPLRLLSQLRPRIRPLHGPAPSVSCCICLLCGLSVTWVEGWGMFSAPLVAREWGRGGDKQQNVSLFVRFLHTVLCDAVYGETTDRLCWLPEPIPLLKNKKLIYVQHCSYIPLQKYYDPKVGPS